MPLPPMLQLTQFTPSTMKESTAIIIGSIGAILILPACFVSPALVLGCAALMGVSLADQFRR